MNTLPPLRLDVCRDLPPQPAADYVVYWMTAARRTRWNFALQRAVDWASELQRPLVIVEVRRRGRRDFGLAEETLDRRKRMALRRARGRLLETGTLPDGRRLPSLPLRVDLVAIDPGPDGGLSIRHHRGIRP